MSTEAPYSSRVFEECFVRSSVLEPGVRSEALTHPATRRLLVTGLGYYVDRDHLHFSSRPRGDAFTRIFLGLGGSGAFRIGGKLRHLSPGTVVVLPAWTPNFSQPGRSGWSLWWCDFVGTDVADLFASAGIDSTNPTVRARDPYGLAGLLLSILETYEQGHWPERLLEANGIAWTILSRIIVDASAGERAAPVDRAMDYVADHLADDIRVTDVAATVGLSVSQLQKLVNRAIGKGVLAYQAELRMVRARQLLAQTPQSVAHVARAVGYADPYYFSRHFRGMTGLSPSEYRRQAAVSFTGDPEPVEQALPLTAAPTPE